MEDMFLRAFDKTQLMRLVLSFYCDNPNYKMSTAEFIGIVCTLSDKIVQDMGRKD